MNLLDARFDGTAIGFALGIGLLCAVVAWCSCARVPHSPCLVDAQAVKK